MGVAVGGAVVEVVAAVEVFAEAAMDGVAVVVVVAAVNDEDVVVVDSAAAADAAGLADVVVAVAAVAAAAAAPALPVTSPSLIGKLGDCCRISFFKTCTITIITINEAKKIKTVELTNEIQ